MLGVNGGCDGTDPPSCRYKEKKKRAIRIHNAIKHPTGIPLTLSRTPKVEAAWGCGRELATTTPSAMLLHSGEPARPDCRRGRQRCRAGADHSSAASCSVVYLFCFPEETLQPRSPCGEHSTELLFESMSDEPVLPILL